MSFVSALLITLKGILPLAALAEPAVAAGLCPTPQQRSKPLCKPLLSLAARQEGKALQPFPSSSDSVLGALRVKVKPLRGRLRRALTLHRACPAIPAARCTSQTFRRIRKGDPYPRGPFCYVVLSKPCTLVGVIMPPVTASIPYARKTLVSKNLHWLTLRPLA